ncbi:hypothetical protein ACFO5R_06930 [Halosolutus amylolyticus]|uniref:Uncharacterized protein n=1 Tax=Halosolutus amylolyticus TaxID=2932267 RepID=A0ABD5PMK0_9EURY|nr:hypothetical protein [Halosolutus amylolyticus]
MKSATGLGNVTLAFPETLARLLVVSIAPVPTLDRDGGSSTALTKADIVVC